MPKLVLKVSTNVPELPAAVRKEKGLSVKRVKSFTRSGGRRRHRGMVSRSRVRCRPRDGLELASSSPAPILLLWNPRGASLFADSVPADARVRRGASHSRTRRGSCARCATSSAVCHLERELAQKDALLQARETENSELLQVGIALSAERDNDKLLDYILKQVRHIARADAGTLYLLKRDEASGRAEAAVQDHAERLQPPGLLRVLHAPVQEDGLGLRGHHGHRAQPRGRVQDPARTRNTASTSATTSPPGTAPRAC